MYELEEYNARYPHSPDVRLLHDNLKEAVRRAEKRPALRNEEYDITCTRPKSSDRLPLIRLIIHLGLWTTLGYGIYLLIKWL